MPEDHIVITSDTPLEAILEDLPAARDVLVTYFGAGVTMPGQTWTREPLFRACAMRGVDAEALLRDLRVFTDPKTG